MNFKHKLETITEKNNSLLCVGLDPDLEKIPKHLLKAGDPIFSFNKKIIDATYDLVCAYKPNIAFYEAYGINGLASLKKTIEYIKNNYKSIPIILDAKRGDINNTASMYARSAFSYFDVDAITVFPNLGFDSLLPFLQYKDRLTIVLIKTSNVDSKMFQDIKVGREPYYLKMSRIIKTWKFDNIGIFVGATFPKELKLIRDIFPRSIILTAGIGAQKAKIKSVVVAGIDKERRSLICNNSRDIIYASNGKNFDREARTKALELRDAINKYRHER